jgi:hypothetical protein
VDKDSVNKNENPLKINLGLFQQHKYVSVTGNTAQLFSHMIFFSKKATPMLDTPLELKRFANFIEILF